MCRDMGVPSTIGNQRQPYKLGIGLLLDYQPSQTIIC